MAGEKHSEHRVTVVDPYARELLPGYLERRATQIQDLRQALQEADFKRIERAGHGLHGSGAAYGLDYISVIGHKLEEAAQLRDHTGVSSLLSELSHYLEHLEIL